jgi:predicted nucleic acid-binding protein
MKPSVYLETSVVSYYCARPSRDLVVAAQQEITRQWWREHLPRFRIVISDFVLREAIAGDAGASKNRLLALKGFALLDISKDAEELADRFLKKHIIPQRKLIDALHIAVAAVHGCDYLVTWNCTHIANAEMRSAISFICDEHGYRSPSICTPQELMGAGL